MKVIYVKSCMERDPRYRQQTMILQDGDGLFVRKKAASPAAGAHMKAYVQNRELLSGALGPGSRVQVLNCRENPDGSVDFPFCADPSLSDQLRSLPAEAYLSRLTAFREALEEDFGTVPFRPEAEFNRFFGAFPALAQAEGLISLKVTNLDLSFDNIFCSASGYTLIDYEWAVPFPVPLPFVFYRALVLDRTFQGYDEAERCRIFDEMGITAEMQETWAGMEEALMKRISPEETRLDYYATHQTPVTRVNHRLDLMLEQVARGRSPAGLADLKHLPGMQALRRKIAEMIGKR